MTATTDSASDKYLEQLRRYAGTGDARLTQAIFDRMVESGVSPQPEHFRLLMGVYFKTRDLQGASGVLDRMVQSGLPVDLQTECELAVGFLRGGRAAEALARFDSMHERGLTPPAEFRPVVLNLQLRAGRLPAARGLVRQMARDGQAATPAEYDILLDDCESRRAIKDTRLVVDAMIAVGQPPSSDRAGSLVVMMAKAGHTDRAEELAGVFEAAGVSVPEVARRELLVGYAKSGDVAEAARLMAADSGEDGPGSLQLNAILAAQLKAEDYDASWATAEQMWNSFAIPTSANLDALFDLSAAKGNLDQAVGTLDWMQILGAPMPPSRVGRAISAYLKSNRLPDALRLLNQAVKTDVAVDRRDARGVFEAMLRAGDIDGALRLVDRLRKAQILTQSKHYGAVVGAMLRAKRRDDAITLVERMLLQKMQAPAAAGTIITSLVKGKDLDKAQALYDKIHEAGSKVDEDTHRELMWGWARKGNAAKTQAVYDAMVKDGVKADDRHEAALKWVSGETVRKLPDGTEISLESLADAPDPNAKPEAEPEGEAKARAEGDATVEAEGEASAEAPAAAAAPPVEAEQTPTAPAGTAPATTTAPAEPTPAEPAAPAVAEPSAPTAPAAPAVPGGDASKTDA